MVRPRSYALYYLRLDPKIVCALVHFTATCVLILDRSCDVARPSVSGPLEFPVHIRMTTRLGGDKTPCHNFIILMTDSKLII